MSEELIFYPMLEERHLAALGYTTEAPQFFYSEDYEAFPLLLENPHETSRSFSAKIRDARCTWYPETHDLLLHKQCKMVSAYAVFGMDGIAASTATLGVALRWISSKSDERGVIPFGSFTRADSASEFELNYRFEKGKLKGSLKLQTVVYLKDPGHIQKDEVFFAQQPGTILGVLDQSEIYIDGNGSIFPIVSVNAPGKALWTVFFNDTCDPMHDAFDEENVEIRLNRAHSSYESLKIEGSLSESPLFLEVLSSALFVIVSAAKDCLGEEWENVMARDDLEPGSIAAAISHFVRKLHWDVSSTTKLAESIKVFFETAGAGGT